MRSLRAVLVAVPPFVADLIRRVLAERANVLIVAELFGPAAALARLHTLSPDVVILGEAARSSELDAESVRLALPGARVLVLSADLTEIRGPGADDVATFTPNTLADRLLSGRDERI